MVFSGLITACRFAASPTRRTPFLVKATIEGVIRAPSALGITMGTPFSMTATQELVVPRSMPITVDLPYWGRGDAPAWVTFLGGGSDLGCLGGGSLDRSAKDGGILYACSRALAKALT